MRQHVLPVMGLLATLLPGAARAQEGAGGVSGGDKVRLTWAGQDGSRLVATVLETGPGALVVRPRGGGPPLQVELDRLQRLEVARGRRGHFKEGALIGFLPGFAFGAHVGNVLGCDDQGSDCTAIDAALVVGAITGSITAVAGGLVGLAIRSDRWKELPVPGARGRARLGAALVPLRGGAAAGVTLSF
ncbi:MAG TPA: hypothetical protein VFO85_22065 [Vicinamibacteria bacterium]|nr:hypothetical protein [Vicinamibacteria bacterium]